MLSQRAFSPSTTFSSSLAPPDWRAHYSRLARPSFDLGRVVAKVAVSSVAGLVAFVWFLTMPLDASYASATPAEAVEAIEVVHVSALPEGAPDVMPATAADHASCEAGAGR